MSTGTGTFTDRYVWGVLRAIPAEQRADLEPEIRGLVLDAMEARIAAGAEPTAAERAALVELGDPERLAARYTDQTLYLVGPRYYPEWRRLLRLLLPVVLPIVAVAVAGATYLGYMDGAQGGGLVQAVLSGLGTALTTGIMMVFWFTVVFAIMERVEIKSLDRELAWSPDKLPELPARTATESLADLAWSTAFLLIAGTALVWQQTAMPITLGGASYPLFDPDLWSFWLPYFLVLFGVEIAFHVARYRRGGWTWAFAIANAALRLAFAVPALYLWSQGLLFDPGLVAALDTLDLTEALRSGGVVVAIVFIATTAWDVVDGFRKAARAARADGRQARA